MNENDTMNLFKITYLCHDDLIGLKEALSILHLELNIKSFIF